MREAWKEAEGRRGSKGFGVRVGDIYDEGKGRTRTEVFIFRIFKVPFRPPSPKLARISPSSHQTLGW